MYHSSGDLQTNSLEHHGLPLCCRCIVREQEAVVYSSSKRCTCMWNNSTRGGGWDSKTAHSAKNECGTA